jgi:hypothetical protein
LSTTNSRRGESRRRRRRRLRKRRRRRNRRLIRRRGVMRGSTRIITRKNSKLTFVKIPRHCPFFLLVKVGWK